MQLYGPKEGLKLYMQHQAAQKAEREAKKKAEAAAAAARAAKAAWYDDFPTVVERVADLRAELAGLQNVLVTCGCVCACVRASPPYDTFGSFVHRC